MQWTRHRSINLIRIEENEIILFLLPRFITTKYQKYPRIVVQFHLSLGIKQLLIFVEKSHLNDCVDETTLQSSCLSYSSVIDFFCVSFNLLLICSPLFLFPLLHIRVHSSHHATKSSVTSPTRPVLFCFLPWSKSSLSSPVTNERNTNRS